MMLESMKQSAAIDVGAVEAGISELEPFFQSCDGGLAVLVWPRLSENRFEASDDEFFEGGALLSCRDFGTSENVFGQINGRLRLAINTGIRLIIKLAARLGSIHINIS